jgi:hypothetical protein
MMLIAQEKMSSRSAWLRFSMLVAIGCAAVALRAVDAAGVGWLPFRTSCGAVTGLPCVFCGMTRAMHHLLNGDPVRALYLNWLAFPLTAIVLVLVIKLAAEAALRRRVHMPLPQLRLAPHTIAAAILVTLFLLWGVQVSLAVAFHKRELLNPSGLLYSLFLN